MLQGIYSNALTLEAASREHEAIAKNLAHSQMPGYRRMQLVHGAFEKNLGEADEKSSKSSNAGLHGVDFTYDFTPGAMEQTDRQFDVAINGDGFFVLEHEEEGPLYTRNGAFTVDSTGKLVSQQGLPVEGVNGPILIGADRSLSDIRINAKGVVLAGKTPLGQIRVVNFEDPTQLESAGTTLFRAPDDVDAETIDGSVAQGFLERANVHPVHELVAMIASQRRHEAASRSMKTMVKSLEQHINLSR